MFLAELLNEQKENFIDLGLYAVKANGVIEEKEKEVMDAYCLEMGVEKCWSEPRKSLEEVLSDLKKRSSISDLKKITVEIAALLMADGEFDKEEIAFIDKVANSFGLDNKVMGDIIFATQHLLLSYKLLDKAVY